jgi:hypothetical protein
MDKLAPKNSEAQTTTPSYDDEVLSEEEIQEALRAGREKKALQRVKSEYWDKITNTNRWKIPNAAELKAGLLLTIGVGGLPYKLTNANESVVNLLCRYFAADASFNDAEEGFSLSKGIMLCGPVGVGKTHLMNYFHTNPHASFTIPTCKDIAEKFRTNWTKDESSALEYYSRAVVANAGHKYGQELLGTCFGDLGAESESTKNFGNSRNVMEEIIFNRYETKLPFNLTHFTTNLDAKMLRDKYGERFTDRLREMCNVISLKGTSFRK